MEKLNGLMSECNNSIKIVADKISIKENTLRKKLTKIHEDELYKYQAIEMWREKNQQNHNLNN